MTGANTYYAEMDTAERIASAHRQADWITRYLGRFGTVMPRFRGEQLEHAKFHAERQLEAINAAIESYRKRGE